MTESTKVCMKWLRDADGCPYGADCKFEHSKEATTCVDWKLGRCKYGEQKCRFLHDYNVTFALNKWSGDRLCVPINLRQQVRILIEPLMHDQDTLEFIMDEILRRDRSAIPSIVTDKERILRWAAIYGRDSESKILATRTSVIKLENNRNRDIHSSAIARSSQCIDVQGSVDRPINVHLNHPAQSMPWPTAAQHRMPDKRENNEYTPCVDSGSTQPVAEQTRVKHLVLQLNNEMLLQTEAKEQCIEVENALSKLKTECEPTVIDMKQTMADIQTEEAELCRIVQLQNEFFSKYVTLVAERESMETECNRKKKALEIIKVNLSKAVKEETTLLKQKAKYTGLYDKHTARVATYKKEMDKIKAKHEEILCLFPCAEYYNTESSSKPPEVCSVAHEYPEPEDYLCPITHELMKDPVQASDGHTYERSAIEKWLEIRTTSPKNGTILQPILTPNHLVRRLILEWEENKVMQQQKPELHTCTTGDTIQVFVKSASAKCTLTIDVKPTGLVEDILRKLEASPFIAVPVDDIKLLFGGKVLHNYTTLAEYDICRGSIIEQEVREL